MKDNNISMSQYLNNDVDKTKKQTVTYALVMDSLMYAQFCTRLIAFWIRKRYLSNPSFEYQETVKKVLRYLVTFLW